MDVDRGWLHGCPSAIYNSQVNDVAVCGFEEIPSSVVVCPWGPGTGVRGGWGWGVWLGGRRDQCRGTRAVAAYVLEAQLVRRSTVANENGDEETVVESTPRAIMQFQRTGGTSVLGVLERLSVGGGIKLCVHHVCMCIMQIRQSERAATSSPTTLRRE